MTVLAGALPTIRINAYYMTLSRTVRDRSATDVVGITPSKSAQEISKFSFAVNLERPWCVTFSSRRRAVAPSDLSQRRGH